jgi:hypothetical protein
MRHFEVHVAVFEGCDLGSLRDRDVFPMNEEEEWRSREEDDRRS